MKRAKLEVTKRQVIGKKVKKLRKEGLLPANIYGQDIKSTAVSVPYKDFEKIYKEEGETGLIDVSLDEKVYPSLIKNVYIHPMTRSILHADFHKVNLKEKIKAMIKIEPVGEAKAVSEKIGMLIQPLSEVEVEALPENLPEKIEVPVEHLAAIDEQIQILNLKVQDGVTILNDPEQVVIKITELVSKEAQEQAAAEEAAQEAAKAETAEGAVPTPEEETKPAEEKKEEEQKPQETPKNE